MVVVAARGAALAAAAGFVAMRQRPLVRQGDERTVAPDQRDRDGDREPPLAGVGVGSQPLASQHEVKTKLAARKDASHDAADSRRRARARRRRALPRAPRRRGGCLPPSGAATRRSASGSPPTFLVLLVHSLFYSGFFEDPIMWGALARAACVASGRAVGPGLTGDSGAPEVLEQLRDDRPARARAPKLIAPAENTFAPLGGRVVGHLGRAAGAEDVRDPREHERAGRRAAVGLSISIP